MSQEHGVSSKSRSKRRSEDGSDVQKSKKRKRTGQEGHQSPTPKRKHKSKKHSYPSEALVSPSEKLQPPTASPIHLQTSSLYLPLSPLANHYPLEGLCAEHISPLILTYYPPLRGTILSYHNATLSTTSQQNRSPEDASVLAQSVDEYAAPHIWLTADFLLLKPQKGDVVEGWVNLQNEGNIGLVCWNFFNASIERKRLPKHWKWVPGGLDLRHSKKKLKGSEQGDDMETDQLESNPQVNGSSDAEGHFKDRNGERIKGLLQFTVKDVETSRSSGGENGFLNIEGTLLNEVEEREMREAENQDKDWGIRRHRREERSSMQNMSRVSVVEEDTDVQ
ncbi:MAG: hypothetical protein Q9219_002672 [cf. Caloplaca sp. 3 TL-2023]